LEHFIPKAQTPNEKLAESLAVLRELQKGGRPRLSVDILSNGQ
jgi:hypothetical protein